MAPRVGILSLQGDFACHRGALESLGAEAVRVSLPEDLEGLDALILPGGESTTMLRLLEATSLRGPLESFVRRRPVLGTCAGLILLGADAGLLPAAPLGVLDVTVERNAYGRQIDSFSAQVEPTTFEGPFLGVFIRAPRIRRVGPGVEVVAWQSSAAGAAPGPAARASRGKALGTAAPAAGEAVGVRCGQAVGLCFHPELTGDLRFHRWFLTEVAGLALPGGEPRGLSAAGAGGGRA